jgi:RNA polymerase sigma-70 factor (ECF subfamily)
VSEQRVLSGVVRQEFSAFYSEAYPAVARALAITLQDPDLGAEAADEGMARCYSHWSKVQKYDNPAGWVYRVGFNWATSLRRRLARRVSGQVQPLSDLPNIPDPRIHDALAELDPRMRSVVVCRFLLDWSVQQTADALNLRPGTVKSRTSRALEILAIKLYHFAQEG